MNTEDWELLGWMVTKVHFSEIIHLLAFDEYLYCEFFWTLEYWYKMCIILNVNLNISFERPVSELASFMVWSTRG